MSLYSLLKKYTIALAIGLCTLAEEVYAVPLRMLSGDQELTSSLVSNLFQDRRGHIWIATEDGLNRYDGTKVTVYRHSDDDPRSLAHNYVRTVFEDSKGHIFVGSYSGLQLYHPETDDFSPRAKYRWGAEMGISVSDMTETREGRIFASGDLICELKVENDSLILEPVRWDMPANMVGSPNTDKDDNVWIRKGASIYKISGDKTDSINVEEKYGFFPVAIYDDSEGELYLTSTTDNIYHLESGTGKLTRLNRRDQISKSGIHCILRYDKTHLLIGTDGNGIKCLDETTGEVTDYSVNIPTTQSNTLKAHVMLRDRDGNMWLAIYQKGVAMFSSKKNNFGYIGPKTPQYDIVGPNCIMALCNDRSGRIWVGSDGYGVYNIDSNTTQATHYTTAEGAPMIANTIFEDSEGTIWTGSYGEGCYQKAASAKTFSNCSRLFCRHGKPATQFFDIVEDHDKRLWIATMGDGIFCYDIRNKKVIDELSFSSGINQWMNCLLYTSKNTLLVGTFDGVHCIDLNKTPIEPRHIFKRSIIFCLYEDERHNLWAGTADGLLLFDTEKGIIKTFKSSQGLPANTIYSINGENDGSLWLSSSQGLTHFFPNNETCINYSVNDGLQGNEFSKNATITDNEGRIWFAGTNGLSYFQPQTVQSATLKRHVRISDFYLNNVPVRANTMTGNRPVINSSIYEARHFSLAHSSNAFSIELSTFEMDTPDYVQYLYSVNDGEWITLPKGSHLVSFTDLKPGTYKFRYKVRENTLESDPEEIAIEIRPEWWESQWAHICYVLAALVILLLILQQVRNHYRTNQKILQQKHAQEINEAKLQFFTNISHEIRTPMTMIISPLQQLMEGDHDAQRQNAYQTIMRNARMLLQLVNQLLDIRKIDNGQMQLSFCYTDIIALGNDIYSFFAPMAKEKNITFDFRHDDIETLKTWVDPAYFDKILINLLSNAFKYTPKGGNITLNVEMLNKESQHDQQVKITVKDNGIGIPSEELSRIFERFYQVKGSRMAAQGNGIGLHLVKLLVGMHHGTIEASNNTDGKGSLFTVVLPLDKKAFSHDNIVEESTVETKIPNIDHSDVPEQVTSEEPNTQTSRTKLNLLVVDDDDEIRNYITQEFSRDFHVRACENGKQALELIFQKQPDIIISDVMMPEMDGITLCRKIKQNIQLNHIPVILLTAKTDEESNLQGLEIGADAYITKPFYVGILRQTAFNLIKVRSQLRNNYMGKQTQEDKIEQIEMKNPDDKLMERIMRVVNKHISDPSFTIDILCDEVGISRVHLYRKLKELTNQSASNFIRNIRLKQSEKLLLEGNTINDIAERVGFKQASYFSTSFKELYGMSPLQWRDQHKGEARPQDEEGNDQA